MNGPLRTHGPSDAERGQILAIMALGIVVMLAMTGLILDGGYAFAQQRANQNGTDSAANAGAIVLAQNVGVTANKTDADVLAAVSASASTNGVSSFTAYYTDVRGTLLRSDGTPTGAEADAVVVGGGAIPPCVDPINCVDGHASGVRVVGHRTSPTFVSKIVGFDSFPITTAATAVAGYVNEVCAAEVGCNVLPVTIPVTTVTCDASGNAVPDPSGDEYVKGTRYVIPLCKNGPGNVGWLDWTPTSGGTSELVDAITHPNNPALKVPGWYYITGTGNINSKAVEDALNEYAKNREDVLIPQFDSTCDVQPAGDDKGDCPAPNVGGNGANQWYHLYKFAAINLDYPKGAYITGSDKAVCDTGNGATSCLVGQLMHFIGPFTTVGPGVGASASNSLVGVQLIR